MDRYFYEGRCVIRINHLHSLREERLQFRQFRFDCGCGIQRVSAGRQFNTETGGWFTVNARYNVIVFTAKLNTRDIFEMDDRTVGIDTQRNFAELLRIFQTRLGDD
ncbi:hypothetical protein NGUA15_00321 [Salmonella enterica]|nr:hypothetical protein NGUA15_00321 [Salmonella enterica]